MVNRNICTKPKATPNTQITTDTNKKPTLPYVQDTTPTLMILLLLRHRSSSSSSLSLLMSLLLMVMMMTSSSFTFVITGRTTIQVLQRQVLQRRLRNHPPPQPTTTSTTTSTRCYYASSSSSSDNNDDDTTTKSPTTSTSTSSPSPYHYRLYYFNSRGSVEPIRYFFKIHNIPFDDVRYPITATSQGFGTTSIYQQHKDMGMFQANMNRLPILQVIEKKTKTKKSQDVDQEEDERVVATIGQTYSILRYFEDQRMSTSSSSSSFPSFSSSILLRKAYIDSFVECIRDVKSAWYAAKKKDAKAQFLQQELKDWCIKLEQSLLPPTTPMLPSSSSEDLSYSNNSNSSPWLFGGETISLADILLYSLLSTPTSIVTGSSQSFFDGATSEIVKAAYLNNNSTTTCPRLVKSIRATQALPQVQQYELERPDTFT